MANGGWYGTDEEWRRREASLLTLDPVFEAFVARLGVPLHRNHMDWPSRAVEWGDDARRMIQLYLDDPQSLTWKLWIVISEDRGLKRYWKRSFLVDGQTSDAFGQDFDALLQQGYDQLESWARTPEAFEFAGDITPLPGEL